MEMSPSLKDFMSNLEQGPCGVEDARLVIDKCSKNASPILDFQQMRLSDHDLSAIVPLLQPLASHVTTLNLFMNEISTLPASLAVLSNLQVLLAGCNPLENIENGLFSSLPSLQRLDIGFSELLEQLPNDFSACQSLEILEAGNGRLKSLPASLFRCEKLQELQLYGNILKTISEDLGFLRSLRILNVGRNQIEALPQSIANCTALETLYLYENCLSALPMGVSKLEKLKTLKVDCNADMPIPPREIRCLPSVQATAAFYATGTIN